MVLSLAYSTISVSCNLHILQLLVLVLSQLSFFGLICFLICIGMYCVALLICYRTRLTE